ncbi:hypothetical protein F5878DRAFT_612221 [Lentinula raphanica]|uniref:Uncharacterized protein n=1 Tax=Lentinula raphanica TaxID=153919 RepID=A0AA38PDQ3_9AGAR|nr:hypothetical protein F5878DRAFT_612221 [Lentinula raphanica]
MHVFRASSPWYSFVVNMLLISIITTAISSPIPVSSSLSKSQPRPGKVVKQQKPKIRQARLLPSQETYKKYEIIVVIPGNGKKYSEEPVKETWTVGFMPYDAKQFRGYHTERESKSPSRWKLAARYHNADSEVKSTSLYGWPLACQRLSCVGPCCLHWNCDNVTMDWQDYYGCSGSFPTLNFVNNT